MIKTNVTLILKLLVVARNMRRFQFTSKEPLRLNMLLFVFVFQFPLNNLFCRLLLPPPPPYQFSLRRHHRRSSRKKKMEATFLHPCCNNLFPPPSSPPRFQRTIITMQNFRRSRFMIRSILAEDTPSSITTRQQQQQQQQHITVYNDTWFDRLAINHLSQCLQSSTGSFIRSFVSHCISIVFFLHLFHLLPFRSSEVCNRRFRN